MFRTYVIAGAIAFGLSFAPASVLAAGKIGKVVAVVGSPSASGPAGSRALKSGSDVFEDDKIVVKTGNAQIELSDGTKLVVGPSSTLLLDQFVMRGTDKADKVAIKALRGTYRFITGRSPKSAYKISTAHATIGIRGTAFDVWSRGRTGAVVLRGAVRLNGFNSGSVNVNSGCQLGEATTSNARRIVGRPKVQSIRENLPFILDQSSLVSRFRLNVSSCNINSSTGGNGGSSPPKANDQRLIPTDNINSGNGFFSNGNFLPGGD
jgi:hypothetical protein